MPCAHSCTSGLGFHLLWLVPAPPRKGEGECRALNRSSPIQPAGLYMGRAFARLSATAAVTSKPCASRAAPSTSCQGAETQVEAGLLCVEAVLGFLDEWAQTIGSVKNVPGASVNAGCNSRSIAAGCSLSRLQCWRTS